MQTQQALATQKVITGALPSPCHMVLARSQLVALLTSVVIPRCGTHSQSRLLPAPTIKDEIAAKWVMSVDRRIVIKWNEIFSRSDNDHENTLCNLVFIGVSLTLGVVEYHVLSRRNFTKDNLHTAHWIGNGCAMFPAEQGDTITIANLRTHVVRNVAAPGFHAGGQFDMCKGRKWVVVWSVWFTIVILHMSALNDDSWNGPISMSVALTNGLRTVEMISDDEAVLLPHADHNVEVLCVDLKKSFELGSLVVTDRFRRFPLMGTMVFHSKMHKVILTKYEWHGTGIEWVSLQPDCLLVDSTHFVEEDTPNMILNLFSTDDFTQPVRVFHLSDRFCCENGFIVLWSSGYLDLVDSITGSWLLRQPSSHFGISWVSLDTS
ncbi:hypothetical protein Pelo_803 [Pelomyxa schiedti]|nr:hypothetical protein Pelo_803 [Pelomyxa schiedti]